MNTHSNRTRANQCAECGATIPREHTTCEQAYGEPCTPLNARKQHRETIRTRTDKLLNKPVNPVVPVDSRLDSFFAAGE